MRATTSLYRPYLLEDMALHWVSLAAFLLTINVISNSGAPLTDSNEAIVNEAYHESAPRAIEADHDTTSRAITTNTGASWKNPNSDGYSTWSVTTNKAGQCIKEFLIKGYGVEDTFAFPCNGGINTHTSNTDILISNDDNVQNNSIYGKKPGQLQVIKDGKCSIRTYTPSNGKITSSSSPVTGADCDAMKKEHVERLQKWQQWQVETFPPCFPFCNTAKPGTSILKPKPSNTANDNSLWSSNAKPSTAQSSNPTPVVTSAGNSSPTQNGIFNPNMFNSQFLANLMQLLQTLSAAQPSNGLQQ